MFSGLQKLKPASKSEILQLALWQCEENYIDSARFSGALRGGRRLILSRKEEKSRGQMSFTGEVIFEMSFEGQVIFLSG
jgi:hypothetical protein